MDKLNTWDDWRTIHQPFELAYHRDYGINWCRDEAQYWNFWDGILEFVKVPTKGTLIDIGCGPRPPFHKFVETHDVHVVDPLLDEYLKLTPFEWWKDLTVYSQPGEENIPGLKADLVMSWNCLDHTIGWRDIIWNAYTYLKPNGIFVCATDFQPPHVGHPGFEQEAFENYLTEFFEILDTREGFYERAKAYRLKKKKL